MEHITRIIEIHIADLRLERFAFVFERWKPGESHYLDIFSSSKFENNVRYRMFLPVISTCEKEQFLDAHEHLKYSTYDLYMF